MRMREPTRNCHPEKVTNSQDDALFEETEKYLVGYKKREKIEKVTASQDDGLWEL
jgi:hypothetical protein